MFKTNIPVSCNYCARGYVLSNGEHCICEKYGMIRVLNRCSKFLYDPLKRQPTPPVKPETSEASDFYIPV
jgi:hypothetical protein